MSTVNRICKIFMGSIVLYSLVILCSLLSLLLFSRPSAYAEILERVVAIVDDEAILLSEFEDALDKVNKSEEEYTREEVMNQIISRMLLVRESGKYGFKGRKSSIKDEKGIVNEYIEKRIKAFIHVSYTEIESFYEENKSRFPGKEFREARSEIEEYLVSKELIKRLREHIDELKQKAYVRIQLEDYGQVPAGR